MVRRITRALHMSDRALGEIHPDTPVHASAYDRIEVDKGTQIDSAAFELKPVPTAETGRPRGRDDSRRRQGVGNADGSAS